MIRLSTREEDTVEDEAFIPWHFRAYSDSGVLVASGTDSFEHALAWCAERWKGHRLVHLFPTEAETGLVTLRPTRFPGDVEAIPTIAGFARKRFPEFF